MQPLTAPFGETWSVLRGTRDRVGDTTLAVVATVDRCLFWHNQPLEPSGAYPATARESATLLGTLAVPREADIVHTDQVRRESTGDLFQVVGPAQWNHPHPMTGWNTGYKTLTVKAVV